AGMFSATVYAQYQTPPNYAPQQPGWVSLQQPGYAMPQGGYVPGAAGPQAQQGPQAGGLDELTACERQDMGVAPTKTLRNGAMHGPTPNQIPGGQVITTKGLVDLMQNPRGFSIVVLDVLGSSQQIPSAVQAVGASQTGSFNDQTQQQFGQSLQQ